MRITTAALYDQSIYNLQVRQQELTKSQTQMTSARRVNQASDDPAAAARAERALASIGRSDANKRALDASRNVMTITESALGDTVELLQTARETLIAAGNGSYGDGERQALAAKLKELRAQLLSVANRPDGSGSYVFGGQGSSSPPFVETPAGVVFQGQGGQILASSAERLALTVDGQQAWLSARTGNGVFTTAPGAANTGTGWVTAGTVSDPGSVPYPAADPAPTYTVQFSEAGGVITYDILEDGNPLAAGLPYEQGKSMTIPGRGMSFTISGTPANGDTFEIGQSSNALDMFSAFDRMINALSQEGANAAVPKQAVNSGLADVDSLLANIQSVRSSVGEALNRMDGIESRIADSKLAAQTEHSNAVDLDMIDGISTFQKQQVAYQAALQSYASVQQMSLMNYLK